MSELWTTDKGTKYIEYSVLLESVLNRMRILGQDKEMVGRNLAIVESLVKFSENTLDIYRNENVKSIQIQLFNKTKQDLIKNKENLTNLRKEIKRLTDELGTLSKEADRLLNLRNNSVFKLLRFEDYVKRQKN
jgi:hypothetical protein